VSDSGGELIDQLIEFDLVPVRAGVMDVSCHEAPPAVGWTHDKA
jgi:hypothetical protein